MLQNIYYNKYIKYKTKYLQLAGKYSENNNNILDANRCIEDSDGLFMDLSDCITNNIWKDNYIELYNILLTIVSNESSNKSSNNILTGIVSRIQSLCILLFKNLKLVYNSSITNAMDKRIINYNMRFIINIVSMIIDEPFESSINENIQFNKEQTLNQNNFYYLEDAFTNDLDLFFDEYKKLIEDKKSIFFYRSNLVNISILLKCFSNNCISIRPLQEIDSNILDNFYLNFYTQFTDDNFKNINKNFSLNKYSMIKLLLESYSDFSYDKVKNLYIKYLNFHYENFKNLDLVITEKDKLEESFQKINDIIKYSGNNYFVYLSCNLPSEFKFQKFEATRILISYLGFRENTDSFFNSIDIIEHDFGKVHNQYERKISYSNDELIILQEFFKKLYKSFNSNQIMLEKIIFFIHYNNYELNDLSKLEINKFIQQLTQKLIFSIKDENEIIIIIILEYINKYLDQTSRVVNGVEEQYEINKIIELVKDKNFKYRLYYNFRIGNNRVKLLEPENKILLINNINKVVDENPGVLNEINKFLENNTYIIDFSKELTSNQILISKIIFKKIINIDVIYAFTQFLYNNYNENFNDNKIYENLTYFFELNNLDS